MIEIIKMEEISKYIF